MITETESRTSQASSLRAIIERLPDGIVIVDSQGTIRFANPAAERLFDRRAEELVGTAFGFPLLVGETTEIDIVQRRGGVVYAELRVVETEWDDEQVQIVSLRDITDRKQAQERAQQLAFEREARLEAEAASKANCGDRTIRTWPGRLKGSPVRRTPWATCAARAGASRSGLGSVWQWVRGV